MIFAFDAFTLSKFVLFGIGILATCFAILFGTLAGQVRHGHREPSLNGVQYLLSFGTFSIAFFAFSIVLVQTPEDFYIFDVAYNVLIALSFGVFLFEKQLSTLIKKLLLYFSPLWAAAYIIFTYSSIGREFWLSTSAVILSHTASLLILIPLYIIVKKYSFLPLHYRCFLYLAMGYTGLVGHIFPHVTPMSDLFIAVRIGDFFCLLLGLYIFIALTHRLQNEVLSFRYAFEQSMSATIIYNLKNDLAFQNKVYVELWEQSEKEYLCANKNHPITALIENKLMTNNWWQGDITIETSSGTKFYNARVYGIYNDDGSLTHKVCKFTDLTEKELIRKELESSAKKLNHLSNKLLIGQEQERQHVARELHDDIGQQLSLLAFEIETLEASTVKARISEKVSLLLQSVRDLSKQLRPTILDELGLIAAINWFVRQIPKQSMNVSFHYSGTVEKIKPPLDISLFRVVQEAVNNALKHSGSNEVKISLIATTEQVQLTIEDFGRGFDLELKDKQAMSGLSLGIVSMKERITSFNGTFKIISKLNKGTKVQAEVYYD